MAEKESNFTGWLNEKILPKVGKFANTRFVRAVMGAGYIQHHRLHDRRIDVPHPERYHSGHHVPVFR